jgi:Chondroitinase B
MATFPYAGFLDGTPYPSIPRGARTVNVATSSALTTAITNAAPGDRIVLASGTYSGALTITGKAGTSSAGISIEAGTIGGPKFASGSTITINNSAYVTIQGLAFPYELPSGNLVQFRGNSHHCRVTRCLFGPAAIGSPGSAKAPFIYCGNDTQHIRIDHNEIRNKANPGNAILADGNFDTFQVVRYIRIDHNYIHSIKPEVDNEKEPIRLGVSTMSKTMSWSVIERNVFEDCIAEPEIVSAKAGGIRITGNVFKKSIGGPVYRHGTDGVMSDNYVVDVDTSAPPAGQTLGVGGVATPSNAILTTADSTSTLTISTSGTAASPRVYDGQGHTVGRINVTASFVTVQNFRINANSQYGALLDGNNITFQNNDIKGVRPTGDGDLNAITAFGNNIKIKYNTAINFVSVDPGESHTDFIQTWVSTSHPVASANWEIIGNKATGPHNPSRLDSVASIHQCVMAEGFGRGGNSGGNGGDPSNWLIADNEFLDSWNQCIKLDGVDNVNITRNKFTGSSTKIMDVTTASTNVKYYSDNVTTGSYESVGMSITSGSGPTSL